MSQEDVIVLIIYNSNKDPGLKKDFFKILENVHEYVHLQAQLQVSKEQTACMLPEQGHQDSQAWIIRGHLQQLCVLCLIQRGLAVFRPMG